MHTAVIKITSYQEKLGHFEIHGKGTARSLCVWQIFTCVAAALREARCPVLRTQSTHLLFLTYNLKTCFFYTLTQIYCSILPSELSSNLLQAIFNPLPPKKKKKKFNFTFPLSHPKTKPQIYFFNPPPPNPHPTPQEKSTLLFHSPIWKQSLKSTETYFSTVSVLPSKNKISYLLKAPF